MRALLLALAFSTVALLADDARACGVGCMKAWAAPGRGDVLPANAPAVTLTGTLATDAGVFLVQPDGGREPLVAQGDGYRHTFALSNSLLAGATYSIDFTESCGGSYPDQRSFFAAEPAVLPTTFGTLTVRNSGHGTVTVPSDGPCVEGIRAAFAQFRIDVDEGFRPWLPVAKWELKVEAISPQGFIPSRWATSTFGELTADGGLLSASGGFLSEDVLLVFGACAAVGNGVEPGLPLGKYRATMTAEVAGVTQTLSSAPITFELSCAGPESAIEPYQLRMPPAGSNEVVPPPAPSEDGAPPRCAMASGVAVWLSVFVVLRARQRRPVR